MRDYCIVCGAPLMKRVLYECRDMPSVSQNLPTKEELAKDKKVNMNLRQCEGCGLVQFDCDPVAYYRDSTRAGERSKTLIPINIGQFEHFIREYNLEGKKVLEIGAGKGGFLKTLKEVAKGNISEYGIENNPELAKTARESEGVNVRQGNPEDPETVIDGAPFDAFYSLAYPARLVNPNGMMQLARKNIVESGVGLIRVPSFEHLLKPGGFYDIVRDHIAYYDKDSLRFLVQKNGFDVLEQGDAGNLYTYAIVRKRRPYPLETVWADVKELLIQVSEFIGHEISDGRKVAVWCAGHYSFTVLSTAGIDRQVSYIIDNAKDKKGKYAPGSHIPIFGPERYAVEPVDTILILGPNYIDEIAGEIKEKCSETIKIAAVWNGGIKNMT